MTGRTGTFATTVCVNAWHQIIHGRLHNSFTNLSVDCVLRTIVFNKGDLRHPTAPS
jgi:hypothetical protein